MTLIFSLYALLHCDVVIDVKI